MAAKRKSKARAGKASKRTELAEPELETAENAMRAIAQDAVIILRRELAFQAQLSTRAPGGVQMGDLIGMLRILLDLAPPQMSGAATEPPKADYSRLSPTEQAQLTELLLRVDYG